MNKEKTIREFDEKAPHYETNRLSKWYKAHSDLVLDLIPCNFQGRILDVGCATGYFIRNCLNKHPQAEAIGIDLSPRMIEFADRFLESRLKVRTKYCNSDIEFIGDDKMLKSHFDIITCLNTFHYFEKPLSALGKLSHLLKPDGRLIILERDLRGGTIVKLWGVVHRYFLKDNVRFYSADGIVNYLNTIGLKNPTVDLRINRLFWKGKISTNIAVLSATR